MVRYTRRIFLTLELIKLINDKISEDITVHLTKHDVISKHYMNLKKLIVRSWSMTYRRRPSIHTQCLILLLRWLYLRVFTLSGKFTSCSADRKCGPHVCAHVLDILWVHECQFTHYHKLMQTVMIEHDVGHPDYYIIDMWHQVHLVCFLVVRKVDY